jgi:hypothetical protein
MAPRTILTQWINRRELLRAGMAGCGVGVVGLVVPRLSFAAAH